MEILSSCKGGRDLRTVGEECEVKRGHPQLQILHAVVRVKGRGEDDFHLISPKMNHSMEKKAELQ